jgi:hypothetical protein
MNKKGFAGGPFQLFIAIIVMAMSFTVGMYLMDIVNCWKCNEVAKAEANTFAEKISNVGMGDVGTVETDRLDLPGCVRGFYVKHIPERCEGMCPKHPMSCWILVTDNDCKGGTEIQCIDISGETIIDSEWDRALGTGNEWLDDTANSRSWAFIQSTQLLKITKTGTNTINIGKIGTVTT